MRAGTLFEVGGTASDSVAGTGTIDPARKVADSNDGAPGAELQTRCPEWPATREMDHPEHKPCKWDNAADDFNDEDAIRKA